MQTTRGWASSRLFLGKLAHDFDLKSTGLKIQSFGFQNLVFGQAVNFGLPNKK